MCIRIDLHAAAESWALYCKPETLTKQVDVADLIRSPTWCHQESFRNTSTRTPRQMRETTIDTRLYNNAAKAPPWLGTECGSAASCDHWIPTRVPQQKISRRIILSLRVQSTHIAGIYGCYIRHRNHSFRLWVWTYSIFEHLDASALCSMPVQAAKAC